MKKIFLLPLLLVCIFSASQVFAQAVICPALTTNGAALSCSTPCTTLSVTPTTDLYSTTAYTLSSVTYAPPSFTGGTNVLFNGAIWNGNSDDTYSNAIAIPFRFCFFGNPYNSLYIGTNGNISFSVGGGGATDWYQASSIPGANASYGAATLNAIMACWTDTYFGGGGTIQYATYGVKPCRQFVISWNNNELYLPGSFCTGIRVTMQAVLYETTNVIDINIATRTPCTAWQSGFATVGIQNAAGTLSYTPPGENGTTFSATNQSWRFTPSGPIYPWTYTWSGPGGVVGNGATVNVCPTANTTYTVMATAASCPPDTLYAQATVTTNGSLTPIKGIDSICIGTGTTLSDSTLGGTWTSSNPAVASINISTGAVTGLSGGTVTISYGQSGCTQYFPFTVVDPQISGGAPTICPGGTTTFISTPPGGTWTSSNTGAAVIGSTSGVTTGVAAGATIISYMVAPGCLASQPLAVTVVAPITGTTSLCQNTTSTLGETAIGGTWSSNNTAVATIGTTSGIVSGISPGTAIITYQLGGGCYVTTPVTINPVSPITGVTNECQYFTTTLSNAQAGGTWSSTPTSIATVDPSSGVVYGVTGGIATIKYTTPFGCISTIPDTVHPKPALPTAAAGPYCQFFGPTPVLVASGGGPIYTWYGPGVTTGYFPGPNPSTVIAGTDSFYVTQTTTFGCVSDSALIKVVIKPKPAEPTVHPASYCQGAAALPLSYNVDSLAGSHLNYYNNLGAALGVFYTPSTRTPTYPSGTNFYVSQTINGCESDSVDAKLNIIVVDTPIFTIDTRGWICQGDSMTLAYDPLGTHLVNGSLMWTLPPGASIDGITTLTDSVIFVKFDSVSDSNIVTLTASNLNGQCVSTRTTKIDVVPLPSAFSYSKGNVCLSDTVSIALSAKSAGAIDFVWNLDDEQLVNSPVVTIISSNSNSGGPYTIRWNDTGRHIIYVQAFAEHGCTDKPSSDTIFVRPLPDASFRITTLGGPLCLEDSVLFSANDSTFDNLYAWTPAHYFLESNKHAEWGHVEQTQSIVTLTVTDPFGCVASSSTELDPTACCSIPFPNAFTPNGDTKNDVFRPIPTRAYHQFHVFLVKNRWGQTIFTSTDNKAEWDGTLNGVPQEVGVYFWYLKYDCDGKTVEEKGDVTLVR